MPHIFTANFDAKIRSLISDFKVSQSFNPKEGMPSKAINVTGFWDTGATGSVISERIVNELKLSPIHSIKIDTSNGERESFLYEVGIYFLDKNGVQKIVFPKVRVAQADVRQGIDLIIGMDIITVGKFTISNLEGKTSFSFELP